MTTCTIPADLLKAWVQRVRQMSDHVLASCHEDLECRPATPTCCQMRQAVDAERCRRAVAA